MGKLTLDQLTKTKLSKNLVQNASTKKGGVGSTSSVEDLAADCHRLGSDKPRVGCDRLTGSCSPQSAW